METVTAAPPPTRTPKPLPAWIKLRLAAINFVNPSRLANNNIVELPLGKILKLNAPANEVAAMDFVRANTTILAPKILDIYDLQPNGSAHILMTRIPGTPLGHALPSMTPAQLQSVASDLAGYLAQLHQLAPPTPASSSPQVPIPVSGTALGPGYDHRLGSHPWGPFPTVAAFHTFVRFGEPLSDWAHEPAVVEVHGKPEGAYRVRYTHADLSPRNILVDAAAGKITGIIDWEFGGWYPEYWEYTKMHHCPRPHWMGWLEAVGKKGAIERYEREVVAEEVIGLRAGPYGYD